MDDSKFQEDKKIFRDILIFIKNVGLSFENSKIGDVKFCHSSSIVIIRKQYSCQYCCRKRLKKLKL